MPQLSIHIDFEDEGELDPRTVTLLENIAQEGSISAAGRAMKISYKQVWELVAEINRTFEEPLVKAQSAGATRGGAVITERGRELIRHYRTLERKALSATNGHLRTMQTAAARH
ncbi:MAG: winged helix-turn-helix domain-containing protein [Reyranellales bacterium]